MQETPQTVSSLQRAERLLGRLAQNDLLATFLDGVKASQSWDMGEQLGLSFWMTDLYAEATKAVLCAIAACDRMAAARLQTHKLDVMKRCRDLASSPAPAPLAMPAGAPFSLEAEDEPHEPKSRSLPREARRLGLVGGLNVDRQDV